MSAQRARAGSVGAARAAAVAGPAALGGTRSAAVAGVACEEGVRVIGPAAPRERPPTVDRRPLTDPPMPPDRDRFEALALPHLDAVYRTAYHLIGDRSEAEDLTQETFLRAYRGFGGFRGDDPRPWLFAILRRAVVDRHRGDRLRLLPLDREDDEGEARDVRADAPSAASAEATALAASLDAPVEAAVAALPPAWRLAVLLADVEGCSYREIAEITGSPIGTVMSRLSRGRRTLRERLRGYARGAGYDPEERP